MRLPAVHLCIIQPPGYLPSLGFLDQARFFRYQFRRHGAEVSLAKNRLRHDAVNFIFGAHLGFDPALRGRYTCIFVNLEQLGQGGAQVAPEYLKLLGSSAVVDYEAANVDSYTKHVGDVPLVSFAYAPYLKPAGVAPLEQRPIDLLFIGVVNERRRKLIADVEASGRTVSVAIGLFGPERDAFIGQAKAVFNCHYYESARFEQARAFQCMSLGTPVISERAAGTRPPPAFEDTVFWAPTDGLRDFFAGRFGTNAFFDEARGKLARFREHDVTEQYANALLFSVGYRQMHARRVDPAPWHPTRLHIGSGKDYKPGWLNIDVAPAAQPDVVLDLARPQSFPLRLESGTVGPVELCTESLQAVYANNVLEHVSDLPQLMTNCLALLRTGGEMLIEVPYERAPTAWQDPTHVRALNENSWIYYVDWFWYLGWFERRFQVKQFVFLGSDLQECARESAHFMRVTLVKVATTLAEKMTARVARPDFGGVPEDLECVGDPAALRPVGIAWRAAPAREPVSDEPSRAPEHCPHLD